MCENTLLPGETARIVFFLQTKQFFPLPSIRLSQLEKRHCWRSKPVMLSFTWAGCYPKDSPASAVTKMLWQSSHFVCMREKRCITFPWDTVGLLPVLWNPHLMNFWTLKVVGIFVVKPEWFLIYCFVCSVAKPIISGDQIYPCSLCDTVLGVFLWKLNLSHWTWVWGRRYIGSMIGCRSREQKDKVCANLGSGNL